MRLKKLSQIQGFSLIEVLIASGLTALVSAGLVSMVTTMSKEQNNQFRTASIREIKTRIQFLVTDQNSWARILQNNSPSMDCINNKTNCVAGVYNLKLYDSGGQPFFDPPNYTLTSPGWTGVNNGFTDKGVACTNFNGNANAGVDTCPITYKVVWEPVCPAVGCKNPLIKVTARMIYNSSNSAQVAVMSQGNKTGAAGWTDDTVAANTGKYDVVIKRAATTINKTFNIAITSVANLPTPGGACPIFPTYTSRGSAAPFWTETDDLFDLVNASGANLTIKAGTYSCRIMALGYNVDTFYIRLIDSVGATVPGSVATSNAPYIGHLQSTANSSPVLTIVTDSTFQLQQACATSDPYDAPARAFAMGLPAQPYSAMSTFASLTCTQTN